MRLLGKAAHQLTVHQILSSITKDDEVVDCINGIRFDALQGSMKGFANGLERLCGLI